MMRNFLILGLFLATIASSVHAQNWGEVNLTSGALILFKVNRNNVPGQDLAISLPALCLYDDGQIAENTFSFGGDDGFPDLLINRNLKIDSEFEARSDTGHIGTFTINCTFRKVNNRLSKAKCNINFSSPARGSEQLDSCSASATFNRIVKGRSPR